MTGEQADDVEAGVARVRARIGAAAARAGRDPASVTLVAVTKSVSPERVARALACGVRDLGENRAQELSAKMEVVTGARWHFIGALQRNKVRLVAGRVALIHSVDSLELARAAAAAAARAGTEQDVLVQVNTSREATKHGVDPSGAERLSAAVAGTAGLALRGLMTLAQEGDRDRARRSFAALRELRDRIAPSLPQVAELSMGMTGDLEEAVEEGATLVRVGTAIFGSRPA